MSLVTQSVHPPRLPASTNMEAHQWGVLWAQSVRFNPLLIRVTSTLKGPARRSTQWHPMVVHVVNPSVIIMYSLTASMQQMFVLTILVKRFDLLPADPCNLPHAGPLSTKCSKVKKNLKEPQFTTGSSWFELHIASFCRQHYYVTIFPPDDFLAALWRFFNACYYHPILLTALCHPTWPVFFFSPP